MNFLKQQLNYQNYRALSKKQKQRRIEKAEQSEKDRANNPQGQCTFKELDWVEFTVEQKNKKIKLCTYRHTCVGQPVAVVIMLHGLNSYIGHGAHIAHHFARHGIVTAGFDHRGFGRSEGQPGYAESLQTHINDSLKFIEIVRYNYPKLPFFCLGLSMGGMTTYYLTLEYKYLFEGAIMMAPAIKNNVGGFLVSFTETLASLLPKKMKLMKPIYGKASRNPQITDDIKKDEFSFSQRASLSTIKMLVSTMDKAPETFSQYKCPFMIVQGGLDKLVNPQGAFQLYDNSATSQQDKQLLFYQNMWHDIWHQPQIKQINQKMSTWILKRLKKLQKQQFKKNNGEQQKKEVKTLKEVTQEKISFKPQEHELSKEVAVTQSQQIRLEQQLQQLEKKQLQNYNQKKEENISKPKENQSKQQQK